MYAWIIAPTGALYAAPLHVLHTTSAHLKISLSPPHAPKKFEFEKALQILQGLQIRTGHSHYHVTNITAITVIIFIFINKKFYIFSSDMCCTFLAHL